MGEKIQIRIYPDSRIEAVTLGIKGKKCTNYIDIIEKLLEAKTFSSKYTDEYFESKETEFNTEILKEVREGK